MGCSQGVNKNNKGKIGTDESDEKAEKQNQNSRKVSEGKKPDSPGGKKKDGRNRSSNNFMNNLELAEGNLANFDRAPNGQGPIEEKLKAGIKPASAFDKPFLDPGAQENNIAKLLCPDSIKEFSKITHIGKPLFNPFEVVTLEIEHRQVTLNSSFEDPILNKFDMLSAYCNGMNRLFISGGDMNHFCTIDLINSTCESMALEENYKSHSMIVVPCQFPFSVGGFAMNIPSCMVFLVGGMNTKSVSYYDMKNKAIHSHSTLNDFLVEPALSLINNKYLYAFTGFKRAAGMRECFERIDLSSCAVEWEVVDVHVKRGITFGQHCFAVAHYSEHEMIFLGGCDTNQHTADCEQNFIFNWMDNSLSLSEHPPVHFDFSEKFFLPVRTEDETKKTFTSIAFPNIQRHELFLSLFIGQEFKSVHFDMEI